MTSLDLRALALAPVIAVLATQGVAFEPKPVEPVTLTDVRGMRFCEFLLVFDDHVEIYNTSASAGCPDDLWSTLDPASIAAEHGAKAAQLNGPKFWAMDEQTVGFGETQTFGGIEARYAASLPIASLGSGKGADPYAPYVTQKSQNMVFQAGNPVYELVDSDGNVFVMNAYGDKVEGGDPANLATQLTLPDGWTFQVSTPDSDLVIDQKIDTPSKMVGDDFDQYYSMIDESAG
ncbi:hypothetical protein ACRDNQ_01615 [Palleronia sp. KMU-117]|uniref:hypothetical protein n=1 Tax=Palleronia sp. KMU-117 TaxID=3434108 RepID=UPI003D707E2E